MTLEKSTVKETFSVLCLLKLTGVSEHWTPAVVTRLSHRLVTPVSRPKSCTRTRRKDFSRQINLLVCFPRLSERKLLSAPPGDGSHSKRENRKEHTAKTWRQTTTDDLLHDLMSHSGCLLSAAGTNTEGCCKLMKVWYVLNLTVSQGRPNGCSIFFFHLNTHDTAEGYSNRDIQMFVFAGPIWEDSFRQACFDLNTFILQPSSRRTSLSFRNCRNHKNSFSLFSGTVAAC